MSKTILFILSLCSFLLCAITQFEHIASVPGLHFDEAWQGLFAQRMIAEKNFWPLQAMNSYTTPIPHYLLSLWFRLTSPSLLSMRSFIGGINLLSAFLFAALLWKKTEQKLSSTIFLLGWALLPLMVHDHRFYVELTFFHPLCLALVLWGIALWNSKPRLSQALCATGSLAGIYSHIFFISALLTLLFVLAIHQREHLLSERARKFTRLIFILSMPLFLRFFLETKKALPLVLILGSLLSIFILTKNQTLERALHYADKSLPVLRRLGIFICLIFGAVHFSGLWPYMQAGGAFASPWGIHTVWASLNAFILLCCLLHQRKLPASAQWDAFLLSLLFSCAIVLKFSPRFFMLPGIFALLWISRLVVLPELLRKIPLFVLTFAFGNLFAFQSNYLNRFLSNGAVDEDFKILFFQDNSRDFRPFQTAHAWMSSLGCAQTLDWFEDDRFALPARFLNLTEKPAQDVCPYSKEQVFFSHINGFRGLAPIFRTFNNTPAPYPHIQLLIHKKEWGDLAFWIRKQQN